MNRVPPYFLLFICLFLGGCGVSSGTYSIIDRTQAPRATVVSVEVAADATEDEMNAWGREITSREQVNGKTIVVNFYHGGKEMRNTKGTFQGNTLIPRLELAPQ